MLRQTVEAVIAAHDRQRMELTADSLIEDIGLAEKAGCPILEEILRWVSWSCLQIIL